MVMYALKHAWGGEIFVPKISSYKILDVANAIGPECEKVEVGIRPGEKIHEEMISISDAFYTYDLGKYYTILPAQPNFNLEDYKKEFNASKVDHSFSYSSFNNDKWEDVNSIRKLIIDNLNIDLDSLK
jgi:FlaA1/EpsC-like NDP-sugar epimerase